MEDGKIIELFFERSEQAIIELSEKYGKLLKKTSHNILADQSDVDECVNDTYLNVWNTIPPQKPNNLCSYVCAVCRNISVGRYHKNTAVKRNSYYDAALDELCECIESDETVDSELDLDELVDTLNEFLGGLQRPDRNMFVRRYFYSDSVGDIADMMGKTNHFVSVRLSRIREKLRKYLAEKGIYV